MFFDWLESEIIPYQEIIGNYSLSPITAVFTIIIPYQEIIGNYSLSSEALSKIPIIPYQEIIGNYSYEGAWKYFDKLYHTKK